MVGTAYSHHWSVDVNTPSRLQHSQVHEKQEDKTIGEVPCYFLPSMLGGKQQRHEHTPTILKILTKLKIDFLYCLT